MKPHEMVTKQNYKGILSTIGNTPEVELENLSPNPAVKIIAKLEGQNPTGSVKDRIALRMIEQAETSGDLNKDKTILEPTSGNTGISLAMIGRLKGYNVTVVMPENVSSERTQLLEAYGAKIIYSDGTLGTNGSIDHAHEVYQTHPSDYFMMYQYGNEANPDAHYHGTALEIINNHPDLDMFVAGLGTGGTLMGNARRLKEHNPEVKVVAVAPEPDDLISGLRRLEDGFIPPILDISLLDARLMVSSYDAFHTTKRLLNEEGIFAGVSSGSVVHAAIKQSERMEQGKIVCLLADGGWKYLSTSLWTKDYSDLERESKGKIWW